MNKIVSWVLVMAAIGGGYYWLSNAAKIPKIISDVVVPEFSDLARKGEVVFIGTCAECHGVNLVGTEYGPPLVTMVYRPSIHADFAIVSAIKNGVSAHHGRFDSMPPQDNIAEHEIAQLIAYIREFQIANGIN